MNYKIYDGIASYVDISRLVTLDTSYVYIDKSMNDGLIHFDIVYQHDARNGEWYKRYGSSERGSIDAAPFLSYDQLRGNVYQVWTSFIGSTTRHSDDWALGEASTLIWTKKSSIIFDLSLHNLSLLPEGIAELVLMNLDIL